MAAHVRLAGGAGDFPCEDGDTLLRAALRAGLGLPYECSVGGCGTCKIEMLEGQASMARADCAGLSERDRAKGRLLACQAMPGGDCTIKVRLDPACRPRIAPRRMRAVLETASDVTHDIREFRFRSAGPAHFLPGQYALLRLPGMEADRAYSMSNLPNEQGEWHFQVRKVPGGAAGAVLFERMRPGETIELDGPFGMAYLREDSHRDVVCIAGGSGLAPMVSIARGMFASDLMRERRLTFLYGARTPGDVCGREFLETLPGFHGRGRYFASISDHRTANGWQGAVGYVHEHLPMLLDAALAEHEFYLAGPPAMVEAVEGLLLGEGGVPQEQLHFDRYC
ncbi:MULTISPECIES: 2Fe-2S iron-sulfur cluster-binding protein [Achromobacter]|uniref:2Fe-2S iron-sulfur cluster-binding protein n=1 Tax=Achromobacter sp. TaxID=134375 RepID=UPI002F92EF06